MERYLSPVLLLFIIINISLVLSGCTTTRDKIVEHSLLKMKDDHVQEQMDKQHRRDLETLTIGALAKIAMNGSQQAFVVQGPNNNYVEEVQGPPVIQGGYITVGDTKQKVARTHGTPRKVDKIHTMFLPDLEYWYYKDDSKVVFEGGRVREWENNGSLKVAMNYQ